LHEEKKGFFVNKTKWSIPRILCRLIKVSLPDYAELPGFGVYIIDIKICPDVETFVVNGKVNRRGTFFKAGDTMKNSAGPAENGSALVDHPVTHFDELGSDSKIFDFPMLPCIKFHISGTVQHDQIVILMGMHVPWASYAADGSRG
jgi:hypothetical protein